MTLLIISGPPATGKTEIANALETQLGWPVVSKDRIKEQLFDERGVGDITWSRALGKESYNIVMQQARECMFHQKSFILEGNFSGETADALHVSAKAHGYTMLSIRCDAPDAVILHRIQERWENGKRHRGHNDNLILKEIENGRGWGDERKGVSSDFVLKLNDDKSLENNILASVEFIKKYL